MHAYIFHIEHLKFDQFIFCVTVMPFIDVKEQAILISVQPRADTGCQ